jgi:hypothetical protein
MEDPLVLEHKEQVMERTLHAIDREMTSRENFDPAGGNGNNLSFVQELVDECMRELSSTHYLTIKALRLLVTVSTTLAYVRIKQNVIRGLAGFSFKVSSLLRISVVAGIQLVLACECVAATCAGCYHGADDKDNMNRTWDENNKESLETPCLLCPVFHIYHSPQYDRATPMRHVCENLLQLPIYMWPPNGLEMAYRYLPTLKVKFKQILQSQMGMGGTDSDHGVSRTASMYYQIESCWRNVRCWECGTFWNSSKSMLCNN